MPSGAKKRKAAKKKKEQQASHNNQTSTNCPIGNDDPKSQDERESDGGEAGSPASQDHNNIQHPFKKDLVESGKSDLAPVRPFDSENKSMDEPAHVLEGSLKEAEQDAVSIKRELKAKEDSGSQSISIRHVEFVKEAHDGSTSSSDNEFQVVENKVTYQNGQNNPSSDEANYSVMASESLANEESKSYDDKHILLAGENNDASFAVVETVTNENEDQTLPSPVTHVAETTNGGESIRDSKIHDYSESQPFIASTPRVEQRTSWMSCCGLFDAVTSSSR